MKDDNFKANFELYMIAYLSPGMSWQPIIHMVPGLKN